jgi:hypothetical protein
MIVVLSPHEVPKSIAEGVKKVTRRIVRKIDQNEMVGTIYVSDATSYVNANQPDVFDTFVTLDVRIPIGRSEIANAQEPEVTTLTQRRAEDLLRRLASGILKALEEE